MFHLVWIAAGYTKYEVAPRRCASLSLSWVPKGELGLGSSPSSGTHTTSDRVRSELQPRAQTDSIPITSHFATTVCDTVRTVQQEVDVRDCLPRSGYKSANLPLHSLATAENYPHESLVS